jgi:aminodeoxyfutalosine synthase
MDLNAFTNKTLRTIAEKVLAGTPASGDDARAMLTTNDILELGQIADHIRRGLHGDRVYYGVNMNLNYSNVCALRCPLCAFSRDACDPDAYAFTLDEIEARVRDAVAFGIDEVHIVGGINPALTLDYFFEMLRRIKRVKSDLFIVAFTAVEYDHFAKLGGMSLDELFKKFIEAGLGAIPGGGAEMFDEGVRTVLAPKKISGDRWLEVMRAAHGAGLKTNATMLYGHIEDTAHLVDHMARIRSLQDETGGFKTFVPLAFHEEHTRVRAKKTVTGFDDLRVYAAARIFLHNVPHMKALWMYLGEKMAQVLLSFGVDDMGATYHYEKVVHAAGAHTPDAGSEEGLRRLIENAGFVPVRSTAEYGK